MRILGFHRFILMALLFAACSGGGNTGGDGEGSGGGTPAPNEGNQNTNRNNNPFLEPESLVLVDAGVEELTTNGSALFWSDDPTGKGIWRSDQNGNDPKILVPRLKRPEGLIVHGNALYWIDTNYNGVPGGRLLKRMPLDGSLPETISITHGSHSLPGVLVSDQEAIYWTIHTGDYTAPFAIERVSIQDFSATLLHSSTRKILALAADQTFIYWMEDVPTFVANLYRVAKAGGTPELLAESVSSPITNLVITPEGVLFGTWSKIVRIPNGGNAEEVLVGGRVQFTPRDLRLYQDRLYWINYGGGSYGHDQIVSAPVNGGDFTVVADELRSAGMLIALETGLYWNEDDPFHTNALELYRTWQHLPWGSHTPMTLASGPWVNAVDVSGGRFYFAEYNNWQFSQLTSLPVAGGEIQLHLGGINNEVFTVLAADDRNLFFADHGALKKVPVDGGLAEPLVLDPRLSIRNIFVSDGSVFFFSESGTEDGLYRVSADGGPPITLDQTPANYGKILAVHDGDVYVGYGASGLKLQELRRVSIDGGPSERLLFAGENNEILGFETPATVYVSRWVWNDQFDLIKQNISTGETQIIRRGRIHFLGFDASALYLADSWVDTTVLRIPKDGSPSEFVVTVPYPLHLSHWIHDAGKIYLAVTALTPDGYLSEILRMRPRSSE